MGHLIPTIVGHILRSAKMPAIVNFGDFVKIAVVAFIFIKLVNLGLAKIDADQYGV